MFWIEILQSYRGGRAGGNSCTTWAWGYKINHIFHIEIQYVWILFGVMTQSVSTYKCEKKTPNFSLIFGYSHIFLCFNSTITFTYTFISKSACWNTDKTNILYLWKPKDSHKFNGVFSQVFTSTALNMQPNAPGKALGLSTAAEITVL